VNTTRLLGTGLSRRRPRRSKGFVGLSGGTPRRASPLKKVLCRRFCSPGRLLCHGVGLDVPRRLEGYDVSCMRSLGYCLRACVSTHVSCVCEYTCGLCDYVSVYKKGLSFSCCLFFFSLSCNLLFILRIYCLSYSLLVVSSICRNGHRSSSLATLVQVVARPRP
jgi:hypothetical protein